MSRSVLCCLRGGSHFIKHLSCITSSPRQFHNRPSQFKFLPPLFFPTTTKSLLAQQWRNNLTHPNDASFSTSAFETRDPTTESSSSSSPSYLSVNIRCRKDVADMLSEALLCFGASSTSMDEDDSCLDNTEISVKTIFSVQDDVRKSILNAVDSIGLEETPDYEVTVGYHSDWIKQTQESFHPVEVAEKFWIVPEWRDPPDLQATNIVINPGLAFGTGDHATTKLCLLLLRSLIKKGDRFLDYGTGSGILAIAALKFGAVFSVGFDIDPQALTAASHNAALNNIGPENLQLHLVPSGKSTSSADRLEAEGLERQNLRGMEVSYETETFDVVIANILLNPLLDLADQIVSYAKPGAVVGLSGIISEQVPVVVERYAELLESISVSTMDDWACISGIKKRNLAAS